MKPKSCPNCGEKIVGRSDKKYCTPYCKSAHFYQKTLEQEKNLYSKIDKQLKLNRKLLKAYNKSGKATVRIEEIEKEGFNPNFFTHFWKNKKNEVYLFCYEYGFLKKTENTHPKYVLVKWQNYMES